MATHGGVPELQVITELTVETGGTTGSASPIEVLVCTTSAVPSAPSALVAAPGLLNPTQVTSFVKLRIVRTQVQAGSSAS